MKATNTSKKTIIVNGQLKKLTRRFLGDVSQNKTMQRKHLKAYLKGHTHFNYKGITRTVNQTYFYN